MRPKELRHALALEEEVREHINRAEGLDAARAAVRKVMTARLARSVPDDVEVEPFAEHGVSGEWVDTPFDTDERIVILAHGDAWAFGSAEQSRELAARIARSSQSPVLSLDYRLAPEHPYPAGRDDVLAALRHLVATGADDRKLALVGISTGAALVLAAAIALRDAGEPLPGAIALLSPVVDLTAGPAEGEDPLGAWAAIGQRLGDYLGSTPATDPGASPGLADLSGLPPMLIQAGGADPVAEQAARLAERAEQAGVEVTHRVWETMIHGWQRFPHIHEAGMASNQVGDWLLQRIGPAYVPVQFERGA